MRKPLLALAALIAVTATFAANDTPQPLLPDTFEWTGPPNNPALKAAWMLGAEKTDSPYLLRVRIAAGGRIPPHTHPDTRNSTVLSGTLYVGFGEKFDENRLVAVPTGGVYVAPAGVPHYLYAKDGPVEYQESGTGPTGTQPVTH